MYDMEKSEIGLEIAVRLNFFLGLRRFDLPIGLHYVDSGSSEATGHPICGS